MFKSILYSVLACFFWGGIFIIPQYLEEFSCLDIVLGRYFFFGIISLFLMSVHVFIYKERDFLKHWKEAALCGFVMNIVYYIALNFGIRFSSPSVIALIVGTSPVAIEMFSQNKNALKKASFLIPSLVILFGVALINVETLYVDWHKLTFFQYFLGLICGLFSLGAWTWYVIFNTSFLSKNKLNPSQWTILSGSMTLLFSLIGIGVRWFFLESEELARYSLFKEEGVRLLSVVLFLAVFCSWLSFTLWNIASVKLPAALSGQLAVLETVFGLIFIYLFQGKFPSLFEIIGITFILGGVFSGMHQHKMKEIHPALIV